MGHEPSGLRQMVCATTLSSSVHRDTLPRTSLRPIPYRWRLWAVAYVIRARGNRPRRTLGETSFMGVTRVEISEHRRFEQPSNAGSFAVNDNINGRPSERALQRGPSYTGTISAYRPFWLVRSRDLQRPRRTIPFRTVTSVHEVA